MRVSFFQWLRGDTPAALRSAKLGIESSNDPEKPEPKAYALVQTANYFFHKGDYEGADEGYKKAASLFADYPPALVGRGKVAHAMGDPRRAAELLLNAYRQIPLAETAWRLGDARAAAGDAAGAEEAYGWVVKIGRGTDPRTLSLFYSTKNRDLDEALKLAEGEMKVRPGIYTQDALAWALHRKGRLADAREAIDKATRHGTKDPLLLYHAGAIRIAAGDEEGGQKLVKEALALSPKFDPVAAVEAAELVK
jgi:tetratricopeptide (TPR) repeat protein